MSTQFLIDSPDPRAEAGLKVRLAIDSSRNIHLVYLVSSPPNFTMSHAIGTPGQVSLLLIGGNPVASQSYSWKVFDDVLPSATVSPFLPFDLAVDSHDVPHLCFQGMASRSIGDVRHGMWNGSVFSSEVVTSPSAPTFDLTDIAMTIGSDDSIHMAFADDAQGLQYATRASGAKGFTVETVEPRPGNYDKVSVATGAHGKVAISYLADVDPNRPGIAMNYAEKTPPGHWTRDTVVPPSIGAAGFFFSPGSAQTEVPNSLVLDQNGVPHIVFFLAAPLPAPSGIRHTTWTSAGFGFWANGGFGELIEESAAASHAKLMIDKNNALHVAYQAFQSGAGTAGDLRFATRTVSNWASATVDSARNSGWSVSAAMDPQSAEPQIAYGAEFGGSGAMMLRHAWALDIVRIPFPHKRPKVNIVRRPG